MNPTKLSDSILKRIENEEIKPRSKWYHRVRYGSFWGIFAIMLVLGALSFAVMLFALFNTDFEIFDYVETSGLMQLIALMPFIWMFIIGLAIGLGVWGIKHTKHGYRMALLFVFGGNVLGSMLLGSVVYGIGGGEMIEEIVEETIPHYESVREKHERFWGNPAENGRLAGLVEEIDTEKGTVTINGPRGREWEIPLERLQAAGVKIEVGQPIKMKGEISEQKRFQPDRAKTAPRQERMHRKIKERFKKNPDLRAKFEAKLSPETRATLETLKGTGERPDPALREQIREEIEANTTLKERMEILPPPEPRLYRGNEDAANPNRPQIEKIRR